MTRIVTRFNERMLSTQADHPPTKHWVADALKRRAGTPRCPVRLNRLSHDVILRHQDALSDLFRDYPDDILFLTPYCLFVGYQRPEAPNAINTLEAMTRSCTWVDEWGTTWGHAEGGVGATTLDHPLKDWSRLEDYIAHQMPNPLEPGRLDAVKPTLERFRDTKYCMGAIQLSLFERLHCIRGMESLFEDFYECPNNVFRLQDALTDYILAMLRSWAALGVDSVLMTDDWGTQISLMISPAMWRQMFRHYYRTIFDEAHRLGLTVVFHSCGNVMDIVGDLIDIGLDVLDPIQPGAMDIAELARRFGGHISFSGGIDDQHLLTTGTPTEVRDAVRRLTDTLGRPHNHGLILSPGNAITPEAPIENLTALFRACHEAT
jgi:uroporphyrinogen decarboxylase